MNVGWVPIRWFEDNSLKYKMEGEKLSSIAKLIVTNEPERTQLSKPPSKRMGNSHFPSFNDCQPFKLLYQCIHPESVVQNNSRISSQAFSVISMRGQAPQQEDDYETIEINLIKTVALSRMGLRNYDDMQNQDVILEDQISNKCKIVGLFDGHGEYGKVIAQAAKSIFQNLLRKYSEEIKNQNSILSIQSIVKKVLQKTNSYILHYRAEEAQFSGTTGLILLITPRKIYSFNIGNSRLVLGKYYKKTDRVLPFQITHDHTIARFDERARVIKNGGVITPFKSERGEQVGPQRIWVKNEAYPGMFITRALGMSCAYKIGVISQPQISIIEYLIVATDGFWSVVQNDEAVKFFEKAEVSEFQQVANKLMGEAVKRWSNKRVLMDDITMVVIALK